MSGSLTSFSGLFGRNVSNADVKARYDEDNVFGDPEWDFHSDEVQVSTPIGTFGGMSPCMGVPPVDYFLYGSPAESRRRQRRRHFSVEETCDELLDEDSTSSSDSSVGKPAPSCDLNPIKSFITDLSFGSDEDSNLFCLGEQGEPNLIPSSIIRDFEARLRAKIQDCSPDNKFVSFPEGLLAVIATHVLQEAVGEPYGIKGCLLHINYEGDTALHRMATLDCDPGTLAKTFELTLTLRQGQATWGQRMARRLSFSSTQALVVSTSYKLVKKRKYRNEADEPVDVSF